MADITAEQAREWLVAADEYMTNIERALLETVIAQAARIEAVRASLHRCENFTMHDCAWYGRDINSPYTADGYCLPCKIKRALSGPLPEQEGK